MKDEKHLYPFSLPLWILFSDFVGVEYANSLPVLFFFHSLSFSLSKKPLIKRLKAPLFLPRSSPPSFGPPSPPFFPFGIGLNWEKEKNMWLKRATIPIFFPFIPFSSSVGGVVRDEKRKRCRVLLKLLLFSPLFSRGFFSYLLVE